MLHRMILAVGFSFVHFAKEPYLYPGVSVKDVKMLSL